MVSLKQIELLNENAPNISICKYTTLKDFFLFFLIHTTELFEQTKHTLNVLDPLFEHDSLESQVTTLGVDGTEFGQLYLLIDTHNFETSFFFYSEEFNHKYFFMENELLDDVTVGRYYFWLNCLKSFHTTYSESRK